MWKNIQAFKHQRDIEKDKRLCLPDFIKVNCRSEGADLGHKSRIWVQVKALSRI